MGSIREGEASDDKNGPRHVVWASIVSIFFSLFFLLTNPFIEFLVLNYEKQDALGKEDWQRQKQAQTCRLGPPWYAFFSFYFILLLNTFIAYLGYNIQAT